MKNKITELEISNFKSIKHIKIDCKRINVFIGKPNVGKSNILEALSLFCAPYSSSRKFLEDYIRYEKLSNLFYDQNRKNKIIIKTNLGFSFLKFHMNQINSYEFLTTNNTRSYEKIIDIVSKSNSSNEVVEYLSEGDKNFKEASLYLTLNDPNSQPQTNYDSFRSINNPIKKYHFKSLQKHQSHFPLFLSPPFGENLFTVLEGNPSLWNECAEYFNQYGLDLVLDTENEEIEVQKKVDRRVTKIPYSLAADTLQRFIFHIAAIESNKDSILLFEEPENHSYPPYISLLGDKIVEDTNNQYFIATHSPYLLTPFLEKCPPENIAIFIADYENYETKIRALTEEEIQNILETGIDLFFNMSAFQG